MLIVRRACWGLCVAIVAAFTLSFVACASSRPGDASGPRRRVTELQAQLDACRKQHAAQVSTAEVEALRAEMHRYSALADEQMQHRRAMQQVMDTYSRGVCLIHGAFTLNERRDGGITQVRNADGTPLHLEYLGSGFLVSDSGYIVTNRHVAEPWWNNESVAPLLAGGMEPAFIELTVTFPDSEPIAVDPKTIRVSAEGADVAVLRAPVRNVPVLPLSQRDPHELRGQRLMLLGYPTGLAALLARADSEISSAALAEAHDTTTLIDALSHRHAIAPVITHGTLSDVTGRQLIYDAVTTAGGSGGPVFGLDGEVIGVNFAVLRDFQGSNFGVPIRFVRPLLPSENANK